MKVTLKAPHTHAGKDYPAGAEIEVDEASKAWLIEQKLVASTPTARQEVPDEEGDI